MTQSICPIRLSFYSATTMEVTSLSQGIQMYLDSGQRIEVAAKTQTQLFDKARVAAFVTQALASDIIILTLHGGKASCPAFDALTQALKKQLNQSGPGSISSPRAGTRSPLNWPGNIPLDSAPRPGTMSTAISTTGAA